jgi:hypothetical protein
MDGMAFSAGRFARCCRLAEATIAICLALLSLTAQPLAAQDSSPDVIRGRVTDDSSHAIVATIMVTRGPDRLTQQAITESAGKFSYDVNPRFADTRPDRTLLRNPFRIVIDFSFSLSTDYDLQRLRRAVEPVKGPTGWQRRSADSLSAFYLGRTSDIYKLLIEQSDSLFLSKTQVTALAGADSIFSARVRELYVPLGEFLARGEGGAGKAELDSVRATQKTYWKIFWEQPEIAAAIVTPSQRELMPIFKTMLGIPMKQREHAQWSFGYPVTFAEKPKTKAN